MATFKKFSLFLGVLVLLIGAGIGYIKFYSYIHSRQVVGLIESIERVDLNVALMQTSPNEQLNKQLFSFAVAIKEKTGEIVTASAEDRQWAAVKVGQCAEAVYYPYPPWKLDKSGTYFGARLIKLSDCTAEKAITATTNTPSGTPSENTNQLVAPQGTPSHQ